MNPLLIGLESLWQETLGNPQICIAVLDGPVDLSHPCFAGAQLTSIETMVPGKAGRDAASEHGTHVASVIFGQHGSPVRGIAPKCRGLILPVYSSGAADSLGCSQLDLARAINQAAAHGAHIINISGGELVQSAEAESFLTETIRRCAESGIIIVAAAGNNGCRCLHVPAAVPSVIAVGAMDGRGSPLPFSNWGDAYQGQGILAPGHQILGAVPGGGTSAKSGTSFAAPIVSGVAGLLLSLQLARNKTADPMRVRGALLETAEPCDPKVVADCARLLAGRMNLPAAHARLAGQLSGIVASQSLPTRHCPVGHRAPEAGEASSPPGDPTITPEQPPAENTPLQIFPASTCEGPGRTRANNSITLNKHSTGDDTHMSSDNQTMIPDTQPGFTAVLDSHGPGRGILAAEAPTETLAERVPSSGAATPLVIPSAVEPAQCTTCAGAKGSANSGGPSLVYALGQVGYDFGTEARRDSFVQQTGRNVHNAAEMLDYLQEDPSSAANIIWTLSLDATVVYAIQPFGPYASRAYDRLQEFLKGQLKDGVERVSIPGITRGSVSLLNGQQVPLILPEVRGMYSWSTAHLIKAVCGDAPAEKAALAQHEEKTAGVQNFLERIYYEIRNLGLTSQERAMNYAATNAFQVEIVFRDAIKNGLKLDAIAVEKSPICRPGSDCWDVKLTFFHPTKRLEHARHVHRFTVDVSDVVPVTVGKVRSWAIY